MLNTENPGFSFFGHEDEFIAIAPEKCVDNFIIHTLDFTDMSKS